MTILKIPLLLLNICGLNPYKANQYPYGFVKFFWGVSMFYNFIPQLTNLWHNLDNINEASEILLMALYGLWSIVKYLIFIFNLTSNHLMIEKIKVIVKRGLKYICRQLYLSFRRTFLFIQFSESHPLPVNENFQSTEKISNKVFKAYQWLTVVVFFIAVIIPIAIQLYNYSIGISTPEQYTNLAKTR